MTAAIPIMCGFVSIINALQGTEDAHYVWRPQPSPPRVECVDIGLPDPICYTVNP